MRLSEAIRLGSLAIQNPRPRDTRFCAIGMGLEAIGKRTMGRDCSEYDTPNYRALRETWTWVSMTDPFSRQDYCMRMAYLFDDMVCGQFRDKPTMTIEQLCDQVRAWEDELAAKGINVEQVTMAATSETTHELAAEHTQELASR